MKPQEIHREAVRLHNMMAAELFSKIPRPVFVLACRIVTLLGESTIEGRGGEEWVDYQAARAVAQSDISTHMTERAGEDVRKLPAAPFNTNPETITVEQMVAAAPLLVNAMMNALMAGGWSLEMGALAHSVSAHMAEAALKADTGTGDEQWRWAKYQKALAGALSKADDGLEVEGVKAGGGGN